ncbi:MAG: 23S rRNA (guanosine(2251)-2'-O)-methyltransferase RlmB [Desulfuromonadales bacterium C00003068]|nr:MAG: 23S rRNA (guanosine(2251)-2'-O)-methyltransferase RlmB [Desulfuromonadales bacterium C00003068]
MADLLYGVNPIIEALEQNGQLKVLWILRGETKPRVQLAVDLALDSNVTVKRVERFELDKMVGKVSHQGVVAQRLAPERTISFVDLLNSAEVGNRFFLVLDGVTDPHNFGALIRSAVAAGCQGIIVGKDRSCPLTAVVEKTSAGATAHIPICRVTNLSRAVEELKSAGVWVYGLAGEESSCIYDVDLCGDVALVAGSEGKGLRPIIRKNCDALLSIPMLGAIESLNVSVATGIALFEVVRRRVEIKK